jgi:glutaredoxin 3
MVNVEIYTRPGCGYCTHAKRLLSNLEVDFIEYDVYKQPEYGKQLKALTTNETYPQIFFNELNIGGFTELLSAQESGLLATMLMKKTANNPNK